MIDLVIVARRNARLLLPLCVDRSMLKHTEVET
jgi:hypothetical protein